jgi:segregation and condensation protein B
VTDYPFGPPATEALTAEDIEAAYERALAAMESVEVAVETLGASAAGDASDATEVSPPDSCEEHSAAAKAATQPAVVDISPSAAVLHPREVIEAALFVGGQSLTTRRLSQMFGERQTPEQIDHYIHELNALYSEENRPYQIDFGEGGYHLVLRQEFEAVRDAVFGAGPKDVKLSQDALEVLAFVAYRQPTTLEDLQEAGKEKAGGLLRQLLRRQLIAIERDQQGAVSYSTTPRFLDVFGLRSLDELPFPEDLELK